ncbi:hypothetical protein RN001_011967 [Aquatica leii]|uniref:Uncharacterized protein n=1 Tax=Aquatica leii TaxID=1421715 RepID=A0AAN7NXZ3_9COLE|nr:hypothetical protein RN001_011967 [Aquatica leii]
MDEELSCTPPEIREIAQNTISNLIPTKSKHVYDKQYIKFEKWCREKKVTKITENALLAYFELQRHNYKSSTLWSMYSMLRCSLNLHQNVDISKFNKLHALLKQASVGYVPKKSKILEEDNINKFINEADNELYLAMKVNAILFWIQYNRRVLYPDGQEFSNINQLRHHLYNRMMVKQSAASLMELLNLPPTKATTEQHSLRVYLQVKQPPLCCTTITVF